MGHRHKCKCERVKEECPKHEEGCNPIFIVFLILILLLLAN